MNPMAAIPPRGFFPGAFPDDVRGRLLDRMAVTLTKFRRSFRNVVLKTLCQIIDHGEKIIQTPIWIETGV